VSGTASGVPASFQIVLHWYNSAAQYWVYAASNGAFTSPAMKPGTYTMVLYQDELKVAESSVTVSAGSTTSKSITSTWTTPANTIFQIGDWDGQPFGFRNADKFLRMHPSDSRMSSWGPLTYTVGSSVVSDFPMALFRDQNSPVTIKFNVPASQAGSGATLRVGTTLSFEGGRPGVTVNGVGLTNPAAPVKIDSRGVTRGAYRGWGDIYTWTVNNLVAGPNTITITAISGTTGLGGYLSPSFVSHIHIFIALHLSFSHENV
jgi:rhamnogalacturonan endolyase